MYELKLHHLRETARRIAICIDIGVVERRKFFEHDFSELEFNLPTDKPSGTIGDKVISRAKMLGVNMAENLKPLALRLIGEHYREIIM
jgi:hypothetical protein